MSSCRGPTSNQQLPWPETTAYDGPCMRIQSTSDKVIQAGTITQESARAGEPFTVCVDPETDQMLIRFDSDRGDVFFTRMD